MSDESFESLRREFSTLYAETLALQMLFVSLCSAIILSGGTSTDVIAQAFDKATDFLTAMQIRFGDLADVRHTGGAVKVVEELRTAVFQTT